MDFCTYSLCLGSGSEVCVKQYNVQPRTVLNGVERFSQTETFRAPQGPDKEQGGRKRRTTEAEDKKIVKWYEDMQGDPFEVTAKRGRFTIDGGAIQKPLEGVREKAVSRWTIYRRLWESDLFAFRPRNKELYTAEEMATRLAYAEKHKDRSEEEWMQYFFTLRHFQNRLRFFAKSPSIFENVPPSPFMYYRWVQKFCAIIRFFDPLGSIFVTADHKRGARVTIPCSLPPFDVHNPRATPIYRVH